jgi:hypothetical protein
MATVAIFFGNDQHPENFHKLPFEGKHVSNYMLILKTGELSAAGNTTVGRELSVMVE